MSENLHPDNTCLVEEQQNGFEFGTNPGGPKRLIVDVISSMCSLLKEKSMCIKKPKEDLPESDLQFYWRIYKSMFFHTLLWSVNNSINQGQVYTELILSSTESIM